MDFITSDKSLKIGDLVFSKYHKHKGELLYKIIGIEARFLNQYDLRYNNYAGGKIGDEYNPLVTIQAIANLSIRSDPTKKVKKTSKTLDASWVTKVDPQYFLTHLKRLNDMITVLWP